VLTASAEAWSLAVRRADVIRELAAQRVVSLEDADAAASRLGVSRRQVYVLVSRWRAGGGVASDLLPGTSSGGRGGGRLPEDISTDRLTITLQPRENNANRARGKSRDPKQIPVRQALLDLYADYLFGEYGELSCDYVFVTLRNGPAGTPMTYWAVMSLVKRLRRRTGIDFHPHLFRHTHATALLRAGVRLEVVSELLTHVSVQTTADTYAHLDADDLADELARTGFWTAR